MKVHLTDIDGKKRRLKDHKTSIIENSSLVDGDTLDDALNNLKDNIDNINTGDVLQSITLSGNVTLNKSDLTGNLLLLKTNNTTIRSLIVGTGFVANDKLTFAIDSTSPAAISITIGSVNLGNNKGILLSFIYDGTHWHSLNDFLSFSTGGSLPNNYTSGIAMINTGSNSLAIGNGTNTGNDSVSIGLNNGNSGHKQVNIGNQINNSSPDSVAIGHDVNLSGGGGGQVAVGARATSQVGGTGIGQDVNSGIDGVALGNTTKSSQYGVSAGGGADNNNKQYAKAVGYRTFNRYEGEFAYRIDRNTSLNDSTTPSSHYRAINFGKITTDNTQIDALINEGTEKFVIPQRTISTFWGMIQCFKNDYSEAKVWEIKGLVRRGTSDLLFVGTPTVTVLFQTSGANDYLVEVLQNVTDQSVDIEIKGKNSETIVWKGLIEMIETRIS